MELTVKNKKEKEALKRYLAEKYVDPSIDERERTMLVSKAKRFQVNSKGDLLHWIKQLCVKGIMMRFSMLSNEQIFQDTMGLMPCDIL